MTTNLDIPSKKTDLYPIISQKVKKLDRVITDKLTAWKMFPAQWKLRVTDYYGKEIHYEGVLYEGSPRLVFWNKFIEPFLENGSIDILKTTYQMCTEGKLTPPPYMKEVCRILRSLNRKTYENMSIIDQRLRGKGFPKRVTPVNVGGKINNMNQFIDSYSIAILKRGKEPKDTSSDKAEKPATKKITPFSTPPGSTWPYVKITFIDDDHVNIKVKGVTKNRVHFSKMGFEYRKTGKNTKLWYTLRTFAIHNGIIPPKFDEKNKLIEIVSPDDVKRLRTKLRSYFKITDNPISYIKGKFIKGKYIKAEGYKTAFHIKDESYLTK